MAGVDFAETPKSYTDCYIEWFFFKLALIKLHIVSPIDIPEFDKATSDRFIEIWGDCI